MFEQRLPYLDSHMGSDCEIHLFVLDLETTYVTHFPEVPIASKKLSSQDQDLRFIRLVWIPSKLFSRLYQGFLSKYKWALTSVSWTWNYTGSLIQPTILIWCLPVSNLLFPFGAYHFHLSFPATSLTKNSQPPFSIAQPPFFVSPL